MITTRFTLCALPANVWEKDTAWGNHSINIHSFVEDAQGIERRISRVVNQDNERMRYNLCCVRLEATLKHLSHSPATDKAAFRTALGDFRLPVSLLSADYLDVIELMYRKSASESTEMRLGATFFPPDMVGPHVSAFSALATNLGLSDRIDVQRRIAFFQLARQYDCGVIELVDPYRFEKDATVIGSQIDVVEEEPYQYSDMETGEAAFDNEGRNAYEILRGQIENALLCVRAGKSGTVNFSNQPHNVITEVLNEFAYSESGKVDKPVHIQVIYTDGSQGKPFPLLCLPQHSEVELAHLATISPVRVALLSMRHLNMDRDADMAWFRNREVSKARAFAETDAFCCAQTQKQLQQSRSEGALKLFLYQTGLQPAVIGFYRALVEELLYRASFPPSLEVIPYYFRSKSGYQQGQPWH